MLIIMFLLKFFQMFDLYINYVCEYMKQKSMA